MARPFGLPKTGGRKKGSRNLRTLVLRESLDRVGFDIVKELHSLFPALDPQTKAKVLVAFLPYLFPKPNPVHVTRLRTPEMEERSGELTFGNLDGKFSDEDSEFDAD